MNTMIERITHRPSPSLKAALKGSAALALLTIIFAGAAYYLAGADYTPRAQIVWAIVGGLLGAVCAVWLERSSSSH